MSKQVISFGEALIDLHNIGTVQEDKIKLKDFRAFPGGAPANVAVAVAKLGGNSYFLGQVGTDEFGAFLKDSLVSYGVDISMMNQHLSASTPLAFVFLDEQKDRTFAFRRNNTADLVFNIKQVDDSWFSRDTILHFCSNTLTAPHISNVTESLIKIAIEKGSIVSFDVNLRRNLWPNNIIDIQHVNQFVYQSHIVKYSLEEFILLNNHHDKKYLNKCFDSGVELVCITNGGGVIAMHTSDISIIVEAPEIDVVDTTGGGDGFVGGLLYAIASKDSLSDSIKTNEKLHTLGDFAAACGSKTVSRMGAFPALPTFDEVRDKWF